MAIVLCHHSRDGHLDVGLLLTTEPFAGEVAGSTVLVACHIDGLVVLPDGEQLV